MEDFIFAEFYGRPLKSPFITSVEEARGTWLERDRTYGRRRF